VPDYPRKVSGTNHVNGNGFLADSLVHARLWSKFYQVGNRRNWDAVVDPLADDFQQQMSDDIRIVERSNSNLVDWSAAEHYGEVSKSSPPVSSQTSPDCWRWWFRIT
jgi:hypothetical protein